MDAAGRPGDEEVEGDVRHVVLYHHRPSASHRQLETIFETYHTESDAHDDGDHGDDVQVHVPHRQPPDHAQVDGQDGDLHSSQGLRKSEWELAKPVRRSIWRI